MVFEEFNRRPCMEVVPVRMGHQREVDPAENSFASNHLPHQVLRRPLREKLGVRCGGSEERVDQHRSSSGADEKTLICDSRHFDRRRGTANDDQRNQDQQNHCLAPESGSLRPFLTPPLEGLCAHKDSVRKPKDPVAAAQTPVPRRRRLTSRSWGTRFKTNWLV